MTRYARLRTWLALANGGAFLVVVNIAFSERICDWSELTGASIAFGLGAAATFLAAASVACDNPQSRVADESLSETTRPNFGRSHYLAWILIASSIAALLYGGVTVTFIDHAVALCQAPRSIASPGQPESISDWIE